MKQNRRELITVQELASELRVNEHTVLGWIRAGRIKALRVGPRLYRIPREEAEKIVNW
mgnify:CR=1 FL=1